MVVTMMPGDAAALAVIGRPLHGGPGSDPTAMPAAKIATAAGARPNRRRRIITLIIYLTRVGECSYVWPTGRRSTRIENDARDDRGGSRGLLGEWRPVWSR